MRTIVHGSATLLLVAVAPAIHAQCAYEDLMPAFFELKERTANLDARARGRSLPELARLPPDEVRLRAGRFLESKSVSARMQPSRQE